VANILKNNQNPIDSLRLSPREVESLLDRLQSRQLALHGPERRKHPRVFFTQIQGIELQVSHPGGSTMTYLVLPLNLSSQGMCFLHGTFLHTGTRVEASVPDVHGFAHILTGTVIQCTHFQSRIHQVGIRFDQAIAVNRFSHDFEEKEEKENLSTRKLKGQILYVEDSVDFRDLMRFYLNRLGINTLATASGEEGVRMAEDLEIDAVALDMHLPDIDGLEVLQKIHEHDNEMPIIVITGDETPELQEKCIQAGAYAVAGKPLKPDEIWSLFAQILPSESSTDEVGSHLYSDYWSDQLMRSVIITFVDRLPDLLQTLETSCAKCECEGARPSCSQCMNLKSDAASYGFPKIAETARRLGCTGDAGERSVIIQELQVLSDAAKNAIDTTDAA